MQKNGREKSEERKMRIFFNEQNKKMNKLLDLSEEISKELNRRDKARKKYEEMKKNSKFCTSKSTGFFIKFNTEKLKIDDDKLKITIGLEKNHDKVSKIKLELKDNGSHNTKADKLDTLNKKSFQIENEFHRDSCFLLEKEKKIHKEFNDEKLESEVINGKSSPKEFFMENNEKKVRRIDDIKIMKSNLIDEKSLQHQLAEKENKMNKKKNTVSEKVNEIKINGEEEKPVDAKGLLREILQEIKNSNAEWKKIKVKVNNLEKKFCNFVKNLECIEKEL